MINSLAVDAFQATLLCTLKLSTGMYRSFTKLGTIFYIVKSQQQLHAIFVFKTVTEINVSVTFNTVILRKMTMCTSIDIQCLI